MQTLIWRVSLVIAGLHGWRNGRGGHRVGAFAVPQACVPGRELRHRHLHDVAAPFHKRFRVRDAVGREDMGREVRTDVILDGESFFPETAYALDDILELVYPVDALRCP